jgi:hypothetical protein
VTPAEVADLLRFCSTLDPWLGKVTPEEGGVMVGGWTVMLDAMPADVAMRAAKAHYSHGGERTLTPGDLLDYWAAQRGQAHAEQTAVSVQQALDAGAGPAVLFGSGREYLADMMAVVAQGGDPSTVTRPAGVRVRMLSPEAEARERACRFPDICVCTHLECRDGWLDAETTRRSVLGQDCLQATRCPQCNDGLLMAVEKGVARKPRRTAGAR